MFNQNFCNEFMLLCFSNLVRRRRTLLESIFTNVHAFGPGKFEKLTRQAPFSSIESLKRHLGNHNIFRGLLEEIETNNRLLTHSIPDWENEGIRLVLEALKLQQDQLSLLAGHSATQQQHLKDAEDFLEEAINQLDNARDAHREP